MIEIRQGDALALLREIPAGTVQTCVTSPPYWGLRDYGTARWDGGAADCDHMRSAVPLTADAPGRRCSTINDTRGSGTMAAAGARSYRDECGKCGARRIDDQLGLEATPDEYVARMIEVFREVRRVIRDDGTLWLNLGDSYAATTKGSGGNGKSTLNTDGRDEARRIATLDRCNDARKFEPRKFDHGLKPKDLVGIPWRVAFALQADGWWLRSDIVWSKPNPMPESITDRPTKAHEYLFLLAKSERYFYDAEAIKEPVVYGDHPRNGTPDLEPVQAPGQPMQAGITRLRRSGNRERTKGAAAEAQGRVPGRSSMGHGVPWQDLDGKRNRRSVWTITTEPFPEAHFAVMPQALVEPCVLAGSKPEDLILDPFSGSGTVGVVALRHGRRFLGLELNPTYVAMARRRVMGPLFAEVAP